jgi:hypothetical protein
MNIRLVLFLVLVMPVKANPTGLEVAAGAVIVVALRTKVVKTIGAVMTGYFLNTAAGKRVSAFMLQRMFGNYVTNNFELGSYSSSIISNLSASKDVASFSKTSSSVASIKEKIKSISLFGQRDSNLNSFHGFGDRISSAFNNTSGSNILHKLRDDFYRSKEGEFTAQNQKVVNMMAQQVSGFCPKIENNYYSENYWKGAFHGSFAAWLSAWFLKDSARNEEQQALKEQLDDYSIEIEDLKKQISRYQELASSTECDLKIS